MADKGTKGVCPRCKNTQVVSYYAWSKASRPMCSACGAILEPCKTAQKDRQLGVYAPPPKKRKCRHCGAFLREGNTTEFCGPCTMADRGNMRHLETDRQFREEFGV